eukprot:COSAG06_NODE_63208_length_263_cov_0.536585_1_plen_53_part_01
MESVAAAVAHSRCTQLQSKIVGLVCACIRQLFLEHRAHCWVFTASASETFRRL